MPEFYNNAIFWVEVERIKPNPFQPRKEFDENKLKDLASSIRQYGVLQPLVVSRSEIHKPDGGLATEYELIAGERRLRASKIAGLPQVPVIIRAGRDNDRTKLELAIIENLQREDLNPIDRALAFNKLIKDFSFKAHEVASKVGKSREYVANTVRLLNLPEEMQQALAEGKITEGHTRPLLMIAEKPDEQRTLFREIMLKKLTVRDAEAISRRIATDRVRKKEYMYAPEILQMERDLTEALGTRVAIEPRENGGKLSIDYMSEEDLKTIFAALHARLQGNATQNYPLEKVLGSPSSGRPDHFLEDSPAPPLEAQPKQSRENGLADPVLTEALRGNTGEENRGPFRETVLAERINNGAMLLLPAGADISILDDRSKEEKEIDENTFDFSNFSL